MLLSSLAYIGSTTCCCKILYWQHKCSFREPLWVYKSFVPLQMQLRIFGKGFLSCSAVSCRNVAPPLSFLLNLKYFSHAFLHLSKLSPHLLLPFTLFSFISDGDVGPGPTLDPRKPAGEKIKTSSTKDVLMHTWAEHSCYD